MPLPRPFAHWPPPDLRCNSSLGASADLFACIIYAITAATYWRWLELF
jgi:hypothetical protein